MVIKLLRTILCTILNKIWKEQMCRNLQTDMYKGAYLTMEMALFSFVRLARCDKKEFKAVLLLRVSL